MRFQGIYASVATPFDHTGALYRVKVQHNFEKWSRTSLAGFIAGSVAGEGALLDAQEKLELLRLAAAAIPDDRALLLDITEEGVDRAARLARAAAGAGARGVVSRTPHLYPVMCSRETQMLFFRALADRSPVPVLIHNAPQSTRIDLLPETIAQLAGHPNIAGVIETGSPLSRIAELRAQVPPDFGILAGSESQVWESFKAGASGAALTFASAAPYATIAIWEAFRRREEEAGIEWQARIFPPSFLVTDLYGVPGLKHAMDLNGYYGGPPRLPFVTAPSAARAEIENAFRDLKG
jgi:4-hydroxy-2-oxoglutarate aldolase